MAKDKKEDAEVCEHLNIKIEEDLTSQKAGKTQTGSLVVRTPAIQVCLDCGARGGNLLLITKVSF